MANAAKRKGDIGEREAVESLKLLAPELVLPDAQRMLGAGRLDDIGDLRAIADVAIQVRCYAKRYVGKAMRSSAVDSATEATCGGFQTALGMVRVPRAKKLDPTVVRWLACCIEWPDADAETTRMSLWSKAFDWLVSTGTDPPLDQRVTIVERTGSDPFYSGTLQAWLAAYRRSLKVGTKYPESSSPRNLNIPA